MHDATQRWLNEQREVIAEVDRLVALHDELNARLMMRGCSRASDIAASLSDLVDQVVETVLRTLAGTAPELAADIHEHGIVMTGGGSLLTGISDALAEATGVPVIVAEDPLTSMAMGAGRALEDEAYTGVMIDS